MPTKRRPITRLARLGDLDPAVAGYLLDGDHRAAVADLRARGQSVLILWLNDRLRELWHQHKAELEAEAARRGMTPWWPRHEAQRPRPGPGAA